MTPENLSELASLYALDMLDDAEKSSVAEQLGDLSEFQDEVAELESIAAIMAYGVDIPPMSSDLKNRLFQKITTEDNPQQDELATLLKQSKFVRWQPYPLAEGVEIATLKIDKETRQVQCFVRSATQVKFPEHRHAGSEEIIVLDGDLAIGDQIYAVGDRICSEPGTAHQPETFNGCVIYLRTSLDDEIL